MCNCNNFSSVQSHSCVQLFVSPGTAACQASLSIANSRNLLKLMSIELDHYKLWKTLKEMGIPDHLTCPLRNLYAGQETALDMEQQTGSKLGKEYVNAVYCHPAYSTYIQSTL